MKRTAKAYPYRKFPEAQQRERRFFMLALSVGAIVAAMVGVMIYFVSRGRY